MFDLIFIPSVGIRIQECTRRTPNKTHFDAEVQESVTEPFYILAVDGGGFRGAFSAHLLKRMEESWSVAWREQFAMFAGTSTGSIIAAGLATGFTAGRLSEFYAAHGDTIFRRRLRSRLDLLKILTSRYSSSRLSKLLKQEFGETTLGDVSSPLIIPSVDIGNGCVHVFKSKYADGFVRDPSVRVSEAVLASCSAPTYFDPHLVAGKYQLVDGGLWANNPALVAAIDAKYRLGISLDDIRVLSIGTGKSKTFYDRKTNWWRDWLIRSWQGWGFVTRWERSKLIDLILNLQADNAHNMLCLLLGESPQSSERVCRLTFESDSPLPMDSTRKLDDWITRADYCFTHQAEKIDNFLSPSGDAS